MKTITVHLSKDEMYPVYWEEPLGFGHPVTLPEDVWEEYVRVRGQFENLLESLGHFYYGGK